LKAYHFLKEDYGLEALEKQRLKVSTLNDLNDPFEFYSMNLSNHTQRRKFKELKETFSNNLGILCFCRRYNNSLLWSHYANRHNGVALEFHVNDSQVYEVKYKKTRTLVDYTDLMNKPKKDKFVTLIKLLTTKHAGWKYEEEYRVLVEKDDIYETNNIPYINIDTRFTSILQNGKSILDTYMTITGIILGPLCKITYKDIENRLPNGIRIGVTKTRLAFQSFNVVKDKQYKIRYIDGKA